MLVFHGVIPGMVFPAPGCQIAIALLEQPFSCQSGLDLKAADSLPAVNTLWICWKSLLIRVGFPPHTLPFLPMLKVATSHLCASRGIKHNATSLGRKRKKRENKIVWLL